MNIHEFLDCNFGENGDEELLNRVTAGEDLESRFGELDETPLLVATRRRRLSAVKILVQQGADINAVNKFGKSSYAHAARRLFDEVAEYLAENEADTTLTQADKFAVAVVKGQLDEARAILESDPGVAKTGNPEEDRLLADVAGRNESEPVKMLIKAGADLMATALDDGTALHQAAWFGQPENARLLVDAGAPLNHFENTHTMSPLGWAVHGAKYSGGAAEREEVYSELVSLLLEAGSSLRYPDELKNANSQGYFETLLKFATPKIALLLQAAN